MSEQPIVLPPGGGRAYALGSMRTLFKADGEETGNRYCVAEWWLEPGQLGPGPHLHAENEELFLVLDGTMTFVVGDEQVEAERGTFLRIPAGVTHDFYNLGATAAGVFNVYLPGGFEALMEHMGATSLSRG